MMIKKEWATKDIITIGTIIFACGSTYMALSKDIERVENLPDKVTQNEKDIIIIKGNQEHIIESVEEIKVVQKEEIKKNEIRDKDNQRFQIKVIEMMQRMGDDLKKAANN